MACFTSDVQSGRTKFTVRAFDESFGKWVHLQAHSPDVGIGSMESSFSVPLGRAAAIGAALIAAAKAAGWVEAIQEAVEPTPEERLELLEMFGGKARQIVLSPEEEANLEAHMAYVEREGHQP